MNDREFSIENQGVVNNTNLDTINSYSDLDFSTLNTDNYQDSTEVYSAPVSECSVNPFSSEVEAPDFATQTQKESVDASPEFFNQDNNDIFLDSEGVFHDETASELGGTEATGVSRGNFAGDSIANQEEINSLIEDIVNDNELEVDCYGTIRNASANSGLHGTDATGVSHGGFAGDSIANQEEINSLTNAIVNNAELEVTRCGAIRNVSANSGLHGTDATGVSQGDFADASCASEEEIEQLLTVDREISDNEKEINDLINALADDNNKVEVDCREVIVNKSSALKKEIRRIVKEILKDSELMLTDSGNIRLITTVEAIEKLAKTVSDTDKGLNVPLFAEPITENISIIDEVFDPEFNKSIIAKEPMIPEESSEDISSNLHGTDATGVSPGCFAGDSIAAQDEINSLIDNVVNENELEVDHFGTIRNVSTNSGLHGTDATGISRGDFAAQWYEKNPQLYHLEKKLMNQRFPDAKEIKLSNGNLAWQIKMNISRTDAFEPWTFLLVYMPDHPNNTGYGGSVKVIPLVPNLEQLQSRVKASKGKYFSSTPPVPHVVGIDTKYLCTRASNDIEDGNTTITTAVQVAAWAAEWALYFELSMRDNRVWNKWVDDVHFRKWKII